MAWNDRPYQSDEQANRGWGPRGGGGGYRDSYSGGGGFGGGGGGGGSGGVRFGSGFSKHSVVTWLIVINLIVFVWDGIFSGGSRLRFLGLFEIGHFSVEKAIFGLELWRVFTYQFLHGGFLHILFNMIGLYFFGPLMEQWWGSRRFLAFYLLCGVAGAVVASLIGAIPGLIFFPPEVPLIGASGSVFGILAGAAVCFPKMRVQLLFPPIPMTMRTMALVFLGIAALSVIAGSANAGGEAAHLGGALLGFLLVKVPSSLGWADSLRAGDFRDKLDEFRTERAKQREIATEAEVNRVLDKVLEQGLNSLTDREKRVLQQDTDRKRNAG
ncbi:MAG: rhomboid family intramembrane serine protease [Planctomycetota bacterium]